MYIILSEHKKWYIGLTGVSIGFYKIALYIVWTNGDNGFMCFCFICTNFTINSHWEL